MGVAQNHGAPGANVVEQLVAVGIVEVGALSTLDDQRLAADGAKRSDGAVDAADEDFLGALENLSRTALFCSWPYPSSAL
jgi:hypothetical protein